MARRDRGAGTGARIVSRFTDDLLADLAYGLTEGPRRTAVIGLSEAGLEAAAAVRRLVGDAALLGVFDPDTRPDADQPGLRAWAELAAAAPDLVVIADDERKERLLTAAAEVLDAQRPLPRVVLAGIAHQRRPADPRFDDLEAPALVPSYATGHPHTRAHLFDCLREAAAHDRRGAVVEFGAFKGGTSVWLAKAVRLLGLQDSPVIAFDAWDGFPDRRSLLDLYEHPRCVFRDLDAVRRYTESYGIELVAGDIYETAPARLADVPILLAFVDTDNYSGARRALATIAPNLVVGGAVVLDHFHTTADYAYTVGERLAASEVLAGRGLLHLQGTGVFVNVG
jgi:O-methyltransferase